MVAESRPEPVERPVAVARDDPPPPLLLRTHAVESLDELVAAIEADVALARSELDRPPHCIIATLLLLRDEEAGAAAAAAGLPPGKRLFEPSGAGREVRGRAERRRVA